MKRFLFLTSVILLAGTVLFCSGKATAQDFDFLDPGFGLEEPGQETGRVERCLREHYTRQPALPLLER